LAGVSAHAGGRHVVALLAFDQVQLLDVTGPAEVFTTANMYGADYDVRTVSADATDVLTSSGVRLGVGAGPESLFSVSHGGKRPEGTGPVRVGRAVCQVPMVATGAEAVVAGSAVLDADEEFDDLEVAGRERFSGCASMRNR
jgi:hypothetical protein